LAGGSTGAEGRSSRSIIAASDSGFSAVAAWSTPSDATRHPTRAAVAPTAGHSSRMSSNIPRTCTVNDCSRSARMRVRTPD
jgi:hypothetical protein